VKIADAKVLITGGGTGIGLAIAQQLADAGAKVAICGRRESVVREAAESFDGFAMRADVSDEKDVRALVARVIEEFGDLNVLVNNAAIGSFAPLLETDASAMSQVLSVNVVGAMIAARECARHFASRPGGGTILNIGSTASNKGFANGSAYALRKHDIRVMQLNPSEVLTGFNRGGGNPPPDNPTKLHAEDVAHLAQSLLELDDRGFVTNMTLWATNPK